MSIRLRILQYWIFLPNLYQIHKRGQQRISRFFPRNIIIIIHPKLQHLPIRLTAPKYHQATTHQRNVPQPQRKDADAPEMRKPDLDTVGSINNPNNHIVFGNIKALNFATHHYKIIINIFLLQDSVSYNIENYQRNHKLRNIHDHLHFIISKKRYPCLNVCKDTS